MPITAETRWRLLVAVSRDTALEPVDVGVAIELIDKLAAGTRTRLDVDTHATTISASTVGICNALERLADAGHIAVSDSSRGSSAFGWPLVLGSTALACRADPG